MSETTPYPLGAYLGNPDNSDAAAEAAFEANYGSFTQLMGAPPQYLVSYVDQTQPVSDWIGNAMWLADSAAASPDARSATPVIGLPMASTADPSMTPDQYYQAFASGAYDSVIEGLVQTWANDGFTTQEWRPGWEMNLAGSPSYAGSDAQTQADWVAAFQHIYTVLHEAGQADGVNIQVVWNPSITNYSNAEAITNLYPGNNYVDVIGADVYADMYPYNPLYDWDKNDGTIDDSLAKWLADPVNREHYWTYPAATPYSLDGSEGHNLSLIDLLQFAKAEGKPFAIPETGAGNSDGGHDVADDAAFPQWLAQTLQASGDQISFVNLWDSNGGGNYAFSSPGDDKPAEAAAWAQYFGADPSSGDGTPCFASGTRIATPLGEIPVQHLAIGDDVRLASGGDATIKWIGRRSYDGRFIAGNREILPILIRQDALADGVPHRDLFVSPLHAMYLDGCLFPASALVNDISIVQLEAVEQIEYFHIELDRHDIILAEGAAAETFVDDDSRLMFQNAAEFLRLYPDTVSCPARFCAPRVEDGDQLERVRQRLAARFCPVTDPGSLRGHLDWVDRGCIRGWAQDASDQPVRLRVLDNGVVIGEVVADRYRADLDRAQIGNGHHAFELIVPGGLSPLVHHVIQVQRASDRRELANSPRDVVREADLAEITSAEYLVTPPAIVGRGKLDAVTHHWVRGWAQDEEAPRTPVALQILDNGVPIARVLANRYRADLLQAGIGEGRHGFDVAIQGGLSPLVRHVIQVKRERDGAEIDNSPVVLEPAGSFGAALEQAVANAVTAVAADGEYERVLSFMTAQTDRLLQQRSDAEARRPERTLHRQFRRRWGPRIDALDETADPGLRALVLDERVPISERDAGSQAVLSHMKALRRLGYAVSFVAAEELSQPASALEAAGVACCRAPFYASVEDVLRRQGDCFDVVYLHRATIAARYQALVRRYAPRARVVYSVADLHHLRLAGRAAVEARPELQAASRSMRNIELMAAGFADAVITHSATEAAWLRQVLPHAHVHQVPLDHEPRPTTVPFLARHGVAFIGNYAHAPNVDAALWLAEAVMPLVWQTRPEITCRLVGGDAPSAIKSLACPGLMVVGQVEDLYPAVFDQVRLTVAPLRYGAGIKGKVLSSFAAGVACVMSDVAADGMALSPSLRALVGRDAAALAALICKFHDNELPARTAANAGLALIKKRFSQTVVTEALQAAVEGRQPSLGQRRGTLQRRA